MKFARLFSVCAAVVASLALSAPIFAGSAKVKVPFAFEVGTTALPAGEYKFVCHTGDTLMRVIDANGRTTLTYVRELVNSPESSKVVFDKQGGRNKLASVVVYGSSGYRTLSLK